jgi:ribosome biogenesis protein
MGDDANESVGSIDAERNQIRITLRLARECSDPSLAVPTAAIAVPADVGKKGLSAVVNHLLGKSDDDISIAIPFDFIVANTGRLLRTGIEREARRSGLSLEEAVPLTYFPAVPAPDESPDQEQLPDWIDTLCFHDDERVLVAGCYDGSIVVHTLGAKGELTKRSLSAVHKGAVKCVSLMQQQQEHSSAAELMVASGSMDQTLKLCMLDSAKGLLRPYAECITGHSASISSVAFSNHGRLVSADWDGGLCVWDPTAVEGRDHDDEPEIVVPTKKSKSSSQRPAENRASPTASAGTITPLLSFRAHASNISGLNWNDQDGHLLTCSWDHSLKVWDVEKQNCLLTLNGSRVISGFDVSHHSAGICATGHPDCNIRLWDTRINAKENSDVINESTFRPSHKEWVSCVRWSKRNAYHLASTSHDGSVKLWDIRSSIPLHTVKAFATKKDKGLCLAFGPSTMDETKTHLFVGGTDCIVKQYQF